MPTTLHVGNLDWDVDSNDLYEFCAQFGEVRHAQVMLDHDNGRSRGFGFVELPDKQQAENMMAALRERVFHGRALSVNIAKGRASRNMKPE